MKTKTSIHLLRTCALLCLLLHSPASGQEQSPAELRGEFEKHRTQLETLRRIVRSLNGFDSSYTTYFPIWTVLDQTLRLKVIDSFRKRNIPFDENDEIFVIASPDTQDIFDIYIGESRYGRLFSKVVLDRALKQELLRPFTYPSEEAIPPGYRKASPRRGHSRVTSPDWISVKLSLFEGYLRFGNDWSIIGRIGDDVLGYPFWSSGQAWLMLGYKSISLGVRMPVHGGLRGFALGTSARRLNGSVGIAGEVEFEWDAIRIPGDNFTYGGIGGSFSAGKLTNRRTELYTTTHSLYSITTLAEGHYALDYQFDRARQSLSLRTGVIYHRVTTDTLDKAGLTNAAEPQTFIYPYAVLEYRHQKIDWFTLTAHASRLLMLTASAEIIPRFVFVEVKYSGVVFRKPKPWEQRNHVVGTLGFTFDF